MNLLVLLLLLLLLYVEQIYIYVVQREIGHFGPKKHVIDNRYMYMSVSFFLGLYLVFISPFPDKKRASLTLLCVFFFGGPSASRTEECHVCICSDDLFLQKKKLHIAEATSRKMRCRAPIRAWKHAHARVRLGKPREDSCRSFCQSV